MAKVFITGSADGLGHLAAVQLIKNGHEIIVHGRNIKRAEEAFNAARGAKDAVFGDLSSMKETKRLAEQVNKLGPFDAIIHNAGIGDREQHITTEEGLAQVFAINSLAPYILTCLIVKPKRLIYISSGMHTGGDPSLKDLNWENKPWNGVQAYSDSKLHNVLLAFAVARKWKNIFSNAVDPGWVPTKMGGPHAPEKLEDGAKTQVWLAISNDQEALGGVPKF